ncbi:MAG: triose-phosphate isomerase [Candidatus Aenigmatarchaeota archaeon]
MWVEDMNYPVLFVNFKTYRKGTGEEAAELAKICENVSREVNKSIAPVVQVADLYRVSRVVDIPIYAQRIDPVGYGSNTGSVLPESLVQNGASGVVINHSEDRRSKDVVRKCLEKAEKQDLETMVCAKDPEEAGKISSFNPGMVAVEPPELIGGDVSVGDAKPELITEAVGKVNQPLICGAGIKDKKDVERALDLGADGVFVASGIVKSDDPEEKIKEMVKPF